jgi:hypothetical protein
LNSARRPLARIRGYQACSVGYVGGLGVLPLRFNCNPTQGIVVVDRSSQLRRPATL